MTAIKDLPGMDDLFKPGDFITILDCFGLVRNGFVKIYSGFVIELADPVYFETNMPTVKIQLVDNGYRITHKNGQQWCMP